MTKSTLFKSFLLLFGLVFCFSQADAQTTISTGKKKSQKTAKMASKSTDDDKASENTDDESEDEVEIIKWDYAIVMLQSKGTGYVPTFERSSDNSGFLSSDVQLVGAMKKADTGGLSFQTELDFIHFLADLDFELISVVPVTEGKNTAAKYYLRKRKEN